MAVKKSSKNALQEAKKPSGELARLRKEVKKLDTDLKEIIVVMRVLASAVTVIPEFLEGGRTERSKLMAKGKFVTQVNAVNKALESRRSPRNEEDRGGHPFRAMILDDI